MPGSKSSVPSTTVSKLLPRRRCTLFPSSSDLKHTHTEKENFIMNRYRGSHWYVFFLLVCLSSLAILRQAPILKEAFHCHFILGSEVKAYTGFGFSYLPIPSSVTKTSGYESTCYIILSPDNF